MMQKASANYMRGPKNNNFHAEGQVFLVVHTHVIRTRAIETTLTVRRATQRTNSHFAIAESECMQFYPRSCKVLAKNRRRAIV